MKEIKSSRAFENLKPSDEQKERLFEKIMEKNTQIETEEVSVRFVEDNRFSLKNIIYPAVAAVIMISVIVSAVPALRDMDKSMTASEKTADSQINENADKTLKFPIDQDRRFRAELVQDSAGNPVDFAGVWNGKSYYLRNRSEYRAVFGSVESPDKNINLYDENGSPLSEFYAYEADGRIFASAEFSETADNPSLEKLYVYDGESLELEGILEYYSCEIFGGVCYSDGVVYSVDCEKYPDSGRFKLAARDTEIGLINIKSLDEFGFYNITGIGTVQSGDIAVIGCSDNGTEVVFFDKKFNVTGSEILCGTEFVSLTVSVRDDHIAVETQKTRDGETLEEIRCYSVDKNNSLELIRQNASDNHYLFMASESSGFDYCFIDDDSNIVGYRASDGTEEIIGRGDGHICYVIKSGDEYLCERQYSDYLSELCTVPYGNDVISSVKMNGMSGRYKRDGHIYTSDTEYDTKDMKTFVLHDTDVSTGSERSVEFSTDVPVNIFEFAVKDDFFVSSCLTDANIKESNDCIIVYDMEGNLKYKIPMDENVYVTNKFVTSDNRLLLTFTDCSEDETSWSVYELDPVSGTLSKANDSVLPYVRAYNHQTGTDGYESFYFTEYGVFGIKENTNGAEWDKIIGYEQIVFPGGVEEYKYSILGFWHDDYGDMYLETDDGRVLKLVPKN